MSQIVLLIALLGQPGSDTAWTVTGHTLGASDPAIIKANAEYHVFSSGRGIPVRVSADLHRWERRPPVFTQLPEWAEAKVPGATGFWAPDISFRDGRYWLYYSVSTLGSRRSVIGLATNTTLDATDPRFRWEDEGLVWETRETDDYNAIDPNAVEGPDGELYLAFGSFWTGLKLVALDRTTGKPQPDAPLIPIAARPGAEAIEGACIIQHGDHYYLFCSHDFTGRGLESTYKVVVGRASAVTGPFVDREGRPMLDGGGTPVVTNDANWRGPGHNAVLQDLGRTWLVYHALDPTRNAALTLRINSVRWTEDGWPEVDRPASPIHGWWEHRIVDEAMTTICLLADGRIETPGAPASWTLVADTLEMHWPDPAAPGRVSVDRCTVAADRQSYSGRNQMGVEIRGRRSAIGWWEHRVDNGAAIMIRLLPGGKINKPDDAATWTLSGDTLELRWPTPVAFGGVWIDVVRLSADRSAYEGRNQNGNRISGWRVASE